MQNEELTKIVVPNYFIVFKSSSNRYALPINVGLISEAKNELSSTKLFFDQELDSTLDIIFKLLHFPRTNYDTTLLSPTQISSLNNCSQSIIAIPETFFKTIVENTKTKNKKDFFILTEDVEYKEFYTEKIQNLYTYENFNKLEIKDVWRNLCDYDNGLKNKIRYLEYSNINLLPLIHFSDFLNKVNEDIFRLDTSNNLEIAKYRWKQQAYLDTFKIYLDKKEKTKRQETDQELSDIKSKALEYAKFPITITAAGQPVIVNKFTSEKGLPYNEEKALNLIGVHNAIETNGIHLSLGSISKECFMELEKLEAHCKLVAEMNGKYNSRYTWRILRKLGNLISKEFSKDELEIIGRSASLNIFSNFPLGLAILPNASAPLCCYKPISYKPITPLTRTFQMQLPKKTNILVHKGSKILIIECLDKKDSIRSASDKMWGFFIRNINKQHFNVIYEVATNIREFNTIINKHKDTLFLIISAHGWEEKEKNISGIKIGESDFWMPVSNEFNSPPIVLLSACHTGSRGRGIISIADLFLRSGAHTVLNTLVPVNVYKNATLMLRFFIYISESIDGLNHFEESF
ncbi:hypothetical protein CHH57_13155 [Niallia circulans]|uniref:CHAT domain-containing protein n=1 Tax=Niallia circulans TaxID=1397 RepID=A0AA91TRS3_NIACI|nr:CHAT domain-containing protein [Niallia circulans]PAD82759.1 hypothetical protein CHH57_13155 [Niallia circulans]